MRITVPVAAAMLVVVVAMHAPGVAAFTEYELCSNKIGCCSGRTAIGDLTCTVSSSTTLHVVMKSQRGGCPHSPIMHASSRSGAASRWQNFCLVPGNATGRYVQDVTAPGAFNKGSRLGSAAVTAKKVTEGVYNLTLDLDGSAKPLASCLAALRNNTYKCALLSAFEPARGLQLNWQDTTSCNGLPKLGTLTSSGAVQFLECANRDPASPDTYRVFSSFGSTLPGPLDIDSEQWRVKLTTVN